MNKDLVAQCRVEINASPEKVWDCMTNPEKIKLYLYGTDVTTDWKQGSPILFQGEYNGHRYKDKGNVVENDLHKTLSYTYWTGFSGLDDIVENYSLVTYMIKKLADNKVEFTWTQQGFASEDGKCHTEDGLKSLLDQIKELAEK